MTTLQTPKALATAAPAAVSLAARAAALGFADSHGDEARLELALGLWGAGLSGKTTHAASFPDPVFFNFDPTTASITRQKQRFPFIQVRSLEQMRQLAKAAAAKELTALVRTLPGFAEYTVRTIVTDSSTFQASLIEEHLDTMTFTTARGSDDGRARYQAKLVFLNEYYRLMKHAREFEKGKEQYMHVVTIHEKVTVNEKGEITGIKADITGDYNRLIFQQNDVNLFCSLDSDEVPGDKAGKIVAGSRKAIVRSVPHTKFHGVVADRVGGLGRYKKLPPFVYPPSNDQGGLWGLVEKSWLGEK